MTEIKDMSGTDASNTALGSINLSEGFTTVDQVNDIARALMGAIGRTLKTVNSQSSDIASAATTDLNNATGWLVNITGTTTITSFGTVNAGQLRVCRFTGALTLTYNATSMILPGAASITTIANDVAMMMSLGSGNWLCIGYLGGSGSLTGSTLRLTSTTDVDLSSTGHAFQIGASNTTNLAIDNNEIQARNNGAVNTLVLNQAGGGVTLGNSSTTVTIPGDLVVTGTLTVG